MEQGITKNRIITELSKSTHKDLSGYTDIGRKAIDLDPEFFAHLISWNAARGTVRDSQVALPVLGFAYEKDEEFIGNAMAHMAKLNPREFLKAFKYARVLRPAGRMGRLDRLVRDYLHQKEGEKNWDYLALTHWKVMKSLYAYARVTPSNDRAHAVLFGFKGRGDKKVILPLPKGSVFESVRNLKSMTAVEAAGTIINRHIPFLVAFGALEEKAKDPDLLVALIGQMSATELVTNTKILERLGMKNNPAVRGAYDKAMEKAAKSSKNILKTTAAINAEKADGKAVLSETTREKLRGLQEKQIKAMGGVDGNWLVLGDKSPSMTAAIETAKMVAATLTKFVNGGRVNLVFFDSSPRHFDVTGKTYDEILKETRHVLIAGMGTSIGCGLQYAMEHNFEVDGIAVVSDAQENTAPLFVDRYRKLCETLGKEPPVYLYRFTPVAHGWQDRDLADSMRQAGLEMQEFDLRHQQVDMYSLPNVVTTMRTQRYGLIDEIMQAPLLSLKDVLRNSEELVTA